ncbi:Peptidase inhibitor I9 OS=Ureibacillus acetophenoni OX=614649 GN=SAMN05877842_101116 PE=3 SV=1 [Ureibacillus acetophenoni]
MYCKIPIYEADFPEAVYDEAYARKTGTSMATPHITGIAALILQANPDWTPFDVKVALSNTAKVLDTNKYDVFAQGAGRVDAYAAAHPTALAYAIDEAVLDGTGAIVENLKGTVTFGPQPIKDGAISVTKQILVKDIKGSGEDYTVTVNTTKTYGDAKVTVDTPTFTLNGEQYINVTLTASQADAPAGSEILGYININGGGTEISLPFAADLSGVTPVEIKNYKITETDLSFNGDGVKDTAVLSFTLTGPVSPYYIELWDIMNPDGGAYGDGYIGYLSASSGTLAAGSYTLNINGNYRNWSNPSVVAKIPDGLYTIDFTAGSATGVVGDYVGPVVVKTTKPVIAGTVSEGIVTGQVTDKYIDYNAELAKYGLDYDLNEKLKASYVATINGVAGSPVPFNLAQNGSFSFLIPVGAESVTVIINDAAGNKGEQAFENDIKYEPVVTLSVDPTTLDLTSGETAQLTVTETSTPVVGDPTVTDVSGVATYVVADESVATVENGLVTAVGEGTTTITITHGENVVTVDVTVVDPVVIEPGVKLVANLTEVDLELGKEVQLTIKEVTTRADGSTSEKDVTKSAKYTVADKKIVSVKNGLVKANKVGTTTITVKNGKNELTINVTVSDAGTTEPEPGDNEPKVSLVVDQSELSLKVKETAQLVVKEVTTAADGSTTEKDVTKQASYSGNGSVINVKSGLVTAKKAGTQTITIQYGENKATVEVVVTK